jgi:hypothetical protein
MLAADEERDGSGQDVPVSRTSRCPGVTGIRSMNTRQERIQLLARMNRARAVTPPFLASLSEVLGEPLTADLLVPLPEADAMVEMFRGFYQRAVNGSPSTYRRLFPQLEGKLVFRFADRLADRVLGERGFLLTKPATNRGAVHLDVSTLLLHTEEIIRLDGDSLSVMSSDRTQGLLIDYNPDDCEQTYEAAVWGDRWSILALECSPRKTP